ncbi:hypothetical protein [Streptomyces sp. NPDC001919]
MSSTGNGDGRESEPSGEGREPESSRDASRNRRLLVDFTLAVLAAPISDWIIQGGKQLMGIIISL